MATERQFEFALACGPDVAAVTPFSVDALGPQVEREHPAPVQIGDPVSTRVTIACDEPMGGLALRVDIDSSRTPTPLSANPSKRAEVGAPLKPMPVARTVGITDPTRRPR